MLNVTKEYLLLFNAITDAEETLQQLRSNLIAVQQKAEELYVTGGRAFWKKHGRPGSSQLN